jgi:capsular polysaccharide biosynthesis protein
VELEAENKPQRTWTPVLPVPEETVAVATFQWKRVPLTKGVVLRLGAIAAAIVVVCGLLAFGVTEMLPKTYGARSEIVYPINVQNPSGDTLRTDRILSTQLVAIKSQTVLAPVAKKYGMTPDALSKKIVASVLQDSSVIRIEADDASQAKALAIDTDVAKEYMKTAGPALTAANTAAQDFLLAQIASLNAKVTDLQGRLANTSANSAAAVQLQSELTNANTQLNNDKQSLNQVVVSGAQTAKLQQLTQPYAAGKVAPKPLRTGIAGVLAGMMIAAGVIVLLLRRRLRTLPVDQFG